MQLKPYCQNREIKIVYGQKSILIEGYLIKIYKNFLFRLLQNSNLISVYCQGNGLDYITGFVIGFDEFMNLVIDQAIEIDKNGKRYNLGRILIKGDCISCISEHCQ